MRSSVLILQTASWYLVYFSITILVVLCWYLSVSVLHILQLATYSHIGCCRCFRRCLRLLLFRHLRYLRIIRRLCWLLYRIGGLLTRQRCLLSPRLVDWVRSGFQLLTWVVASWLELFCTILLETVIYDESWFVDIHMSGGCLLLRWVTSQLFECLVVHLRMHGLSTFCGQVLLLDHATEEGRLWDLQELGFCFCLC